MYLVPSSPPTDRTLDTSPTHRLIPTQHLRTRRRMHVLDLENLCGTSHLTASIVNYVMDAYRAAVSIGDSDLVVVGVSHHNLLTAGIALPTARLCIRSGSDGADLALLDVLANEVTVGRFSTVCIGSGDGIFAAATAAISADLDVVTVGGLGGISRRLRVAAQQLVPLTFTTHSTQEHA